MAAPCDRPRYMSVCRSWTSRTQSPPCPDRVAVSTSQAEVLTVKPAGHWNGSPVVRDSRTRTRVGR